MKLRTKAILFLGLFLLLVVAAVAFYAEYIAGDVFKKQATNDFRIIAEQSETAYISYLEKLSVRVLDWTSDNTIREISKAVLAAPAGSALREKYAKEFGTYVSMKKMPFDKTIILTELLDHNGIVIASTKPASIGKNERDEEVQHKKVHNFDSAIKSKFGEVFFGSLVLEKEENPNPTMNATVRLFEAEKNGEFKPMDAVLLVYFDNTRQITKALGVELSVYAGIPEQHERLTSKALLESYKSTDIYLVNSEHVMVTHSRLATNQDVYQQVDTLPVRECFEHNKEVSEEYDDYRGVRVLGSSMCFQKDGVMIIVEVDKDEVYTPMRTLIRSTLIGGIIAVILGIFIVVFFMRRPLKDISEIARGAKRVTEGNFDTQVNVDTKDELGYLASSFNTMITTIRSARKELLTSKHTTEEEKAKDEALLDNLGEGMVATDTLGNIIKINRMAEKILGWKSVEVIGKKVNELWDVLDEHGNKIPKEQRLSYVMVTDPASALSNTLYSRKGEGYIPVAITVNPAVLNGKIIGSITIFRDITKEKEIEKTRGDLLSLASHQLRTPLSGTKWLIETLKKGIHGPLTSGQKEYLDEIYKINERMTSLVHDMLGVLRMEGNGDGAKKENVAIKSIITALNEELRSVANSKQIKIKLPEVENYNVDTDPLFLRNILESLVSNAINYSESGSEIVMSIEQKPEELVFVIKDSGIGIPKDEQARIFERFYRATNAKTYDTRGSGLGLYIASMLAKKIGVHLSFESEEGRGSIFYAHIPYFPTK